MGDQKTRDMRRRELLKTVGAAALAGPLIYTSKKARADKKKTLKIMQWKHFVPDYDKWFDSVFTKQWGDKHDTEVIIDHIVNTELNTRAAAEVSAKKGHDLFMFLSPPAAFEQQTLDMTNVYKEVEKKHGKMLDLAHKSSFNPKTKRYFAFSDSYVPDPGNYHKDWWTKAGFPKGPDSWDELRAGAKKIRDMKGPPCGMGLSQELDTSMALRALLWSFGGAEQDVDGKIVINSKETIEALKFMKALHTESQTAEVFTWDPSSNNRAMLAGQVSYVQNAISVTRTAEKDKNPIASKIGINKALKGPVRRMASEHLINSYVIWSFAENKEGAQQFLIDYMDAFNDGFKAGRCYNFPCFEKTVPDLKAAISSDPAADPTDKYKVLTDVLEWTTNVGYPGYASAGIDEAFRTFVMPTWFAKVARGDASPEDAAKAMEAEYKRIFSRWK